MSNETGGPAFPPNAGWRDNESSCRGMTLLDWFAGQALSSILAEWAESGEGWHTDAADKAYRVAASMIAERKRTKQHERD